MWVLVAIELNSEQVKVLLCYNLTVRKREGNEI